MRMPLACSALFLARQVKWRAAELVEFDRLQRAGVPTNLSASASVAYRKLERNLGQLAIARRAETWSAAAIAELEKKYATRNLSCVMHRRVCGNGFALLSSWSPLLEPHISESGEDYAMRENYSGH